MSGELLKRRSIPCAVGLALALAGLFAAGPASAATVTTSESAAGFETVTYTGLPGETNQLTISQTGDDFVLTDAVANLTPSGGCKATGPKSVTCSGAKVFKIAALLGDGDDSAKVAVGETAAKASRLQAMAAANTFAGDGTVSIQLEGAAGNDTLNGGDLPTFFEGGLGDDSVTAGDDFDRIFAGEGSDTIVDAPTPADAPPDEIFCGGGVDNVTASTRDRLNSDCESATKAPPAPPAGLGDSSEDKGDEEGLSESPGKNDKSGACGKEKSAKEQTGTAGNDTIDGDKGGAAADRLLGLGGNDILRGLTLGDCLIGGLGNDQLLGGEGDDQLQGDAGNDQADGDGGADRIYLGAGEDQADGGEGNDRLFGASGSDKLIGGPGRDRIFGQAGNDDIKGGDGNDRLSAGSGKNSIDGGDGNDAITSNNGVKEKVDCGDGGKDRVIADPEDEVTGCERVKRK